MTGQPSKKAPRKLDLMRSRAELLHWRTVPRVRKPGRPGISPWLPLVPVLIVLSPALLLVTGVAIFLPPPFRINPATLMLNLGRMMMALSGVGAEIEERGRRRIADDRP